MRALELSTPSTFRSTETGIDDPGLGEVQVSVEAEGILRCGLHAYSKAAVGSMLHPSSDGVGERAGWQDRQDGGGVIAQAPRSVRLLPRVGFVAESSE